MTNNIQKAVRILTERRSIKYSIIEEVRRSLGGDICQCPARKIVIISYFLEKSANQATLGTNRDMINAL